uniref:H15 domain-containing protein n=1 Tax=Musa acuminata subsp. malaccensis TaxID=214687 RepID=A0A804KPY5_MUSAM
MATEEEDPRTHSLPPYPQMILAAVAASGDKDGTSMSAIAEYVESSYEGQLPPSHASQLDAHLARMTEAGELLLVGSGYFRPGPEAPPPVKRRRGRPPKPKLPDPAGPADAAPRRRGRPPKPVDPLAPAKIPRPRGRPPKRAADGPDPGQPGLTKRPRGRPPKVRQLTFSSWNQVDGNGGDVGFLYVVQDHQRPLVGEAKVNVVKLWIVSPSEFLQESGNSMGHKKKKNPLST